MRKDKTDNPMAQPAPLILQMQRLTGQHCNGSARLGLLMGEIVLRPCEAAMRGSDERD